MSVADVAFSVCAEAFHSPAFCLLLEGGERDGGGSEGEGVNEGGIESNGGGSSPFPEHSWRQVEPW